MGQPLYVPEEDRSPYLPIPLADGRVLRKSSCVIRWEEDPNSERVPPRSRPYVYTNSTHPCPGVLAVWCDLQSGYLVVKLEKSGPILGHSIGFDETMSALGFDAIGPSIGGEVKIRLMKDGVRIPADDASLHEPKMAQGNVWFAVEHLDPAPITP